MPAHRRRPGAGGRARRVLGRHPCPGGPRRIGRQRPVFQGGIVAVGGHVPRHAGRRVDNPSPTHGWDRRSHRARPTGPDRSLAAGRGRHSGAAARGCPSPLPADPGDGRHPHPWDDHTVGTDGRTLTFTYYAGVAPCSVHDSIVAEEGPETVRVTIYERSGPDGVVCIMLAQQKSATVTLDTPLGARRLVDGAISA